MKNSRVTLLIVMLVFNVTGLRAATLYWDADGTAAGDTPATGAGLGGTGNWDQISTLWFNGTADVSWINANGDDAVFSGTAGTVTLTGNIAAGDLYFTNTTGSFVITNATGVETLALDNGVVDTGGTTNTVGALLTGSTALTKNGNGTLILSGNNTGFTGPVNVNQGAVQTPNINGLGTGTVTITNSGSVEFNTGGIIANPFVISGNGVNNEGALYKVTSSIPTNSGAITLETNVMFGGTAGQFYIQGGLAAASGVNANAVFGGSAAFRVSFGSASGKAINLHTGSITINGPASINTAATSLTYSNLVLNGGQFSSGLKDASFGTAPSAFNASNITVSNGANLLLSTTFTFNANRGIFLGPGGGDIGENTASGQLTIPGAISGPGSLLLETDGANSSFKLTGNNTYTGQTTVQSGVGLVIGNNGGTGTFGAGNIVNSGTITVNRTGTLGYAGAISGTGPVTIMGSGTTTFSGASTYSGATTLNAFMFLAENTSASATGTGTVTVEAGTLGGDGIIAGPVTVDSGAFLQPGNASLNAVGMLIISNTLTLLSGSATTLELDATVPTNSSVQGLSSITFGGTLVVNLINGDPAAGQSFRLFGANSYGGVFDGGIELPPLDAGLAWNTNELYVNGTVSVVPLTGVFNAPVLSGTNLVLSGSYGTPFGSYSVLTTTNLTTPAAAWTVLSSGNSFDGNGDFSFTNPVDPSVPMQFFRISQP